MSIASPTTAQTVRGGSLGSVLPIIAGTALFVATIARLRFDLAAPLWLDESWTAAFSMEPTFGGLTQQIRDDANAPGYYCFIWLWAQLFGSSNIALHVPSLLLGILTPAIAWLGLRRLRPDFALAWAALLATWLPGIGQSSEARCYALLFCAAVAVTIAHLRLLEAPSLARAAVWAAGASAMTLVHYHAGILAAAQGFAFLGLHGALVFRFWPAILTTFPALAWVAWHVPRLTEFTRTDVAWYDVLTVGDVPGLALIVVNGLYGIVALIVALVVSVFFAERGSAHQPASGDTRRALYWVGGAALAAAATCIVLGMVRPTFTGRYLTPFVPGILLLIVQVVARTDAGRKALCVLVVGGIAAVAPIVSAAPVAIPPIYNYEIASAWLAEAKPRRLVFFWDHPATPVETTRQLDAVGGVFLRRAGLTVDVTPIYPVAEDMNASLVAAAGEDAAILWLSDAHVRHTSAARFKPRLSELNPKLVCRDFGLPPIGVVACRQPSTR